VARALIAKLVPGATDARSQEDLGLARFDYDVLDRPDNPTRIRLSSMVVHVEASAIPPVPRSPSVT
jgi:spermidine dehydrogenase